MQINVKKTKESIVWVEGEGVRLSSPIINMKKKKTGNVLLGGPNSPIFLWDSYSSLDWAFTDITATATRGGGEENRERMIPMRAGVDEFNTNSFISM